MIPGLFPDSKGSCQRSRRYDRIHLLKSLIKLLDNQRPDLLRLFIMRFIIPGAKHVSSQHNPSFYLQPEPLGSCIGIKGGKVMLVGSGPPISDAVISSQIGTGLCRDRKSVV